MNWKQRETEESMTDLEIMAKILQDLPKLYRVTGIKIFEEMTNKIKRLKAKNRKLKEALNDRP